MRRWKLAMRAKWGEFPSKLSDVAQIREHSRSRAIRVAPQNPKISLFRENQVSSIGSIFAIFSTKTPQMTISSKCGCELRLKKNVRVPPLQKRPVKKKEFRTLKNVLFSALLLGGDFNLISYAKPPRAHIWPQTPLKLFLIKKKECIAEN